MWKYVQSTGDLFHNSKYVETGYSGAKPDGKNNPAKECERNVGPIPRGGYDIADPIAKPTPVSLPLTADSPNYCNPPRSGFLVHGDNSTSTASTGCIIVSRRTREQMRDSGDKRLTVVTNSTLVASLKRRKYAAPSDF